MTVCPSLLSLVYTGKDFGPTLKDGWEKRCCSCPAFPEKPHHLSHHNLFVRTKTHNFALRYGKGIILCPVPKHFEVK